MRRGRLAAGVALLLAATGCDGAASPDGSPTSAGSAIASTAVTASTAPSPSASAPTAPVGTRPVLDCLNGTWRLRSFVDVRPDAAWRAGSGGDVDLRFSGAMFPDGNYVGVRYELRAAGKRALRLTAPDGAVSTLTTTLRAEGSYYLEGSEATFSREDASGSGRLTTSGTTRTMTPAEVQPIVTPDGVTTVSCTDDDLHLTSTERQLTLAKD